MIQTWASCPFCRKTFEVDPERNTSIIIDGRRRYVCDRHIEPTINPPAVKGNGDIRNAK